MLRAYQTQPGEQKQVGRNLGLPGNYALYLVGSGIFGLFLWMLSAMSPVFAGKSMVIPLLIALLPAMVTALVIFGFLLGKPPHYAHDFKQSLGRDSFVISGDGVSYRRGSGRNNPVKMIYTEKEEGNE
jgi:hypothetical protein